MCGRYLLTSPLMAVAEHFAAAPAPDLEDALGNAGPRWNVCPTTTIPVVRRDADGARRLAPMRWGLLPRWAKAVNDGPLLINARAETIAEKPAFRDSARERRCLVPADGFYEWLREGRSKQPFLALPGEGEEAEAGLVAFAAVWRRWSPPDGGDPLDTVAVVTTEAGPPLSGIHHREPVTIRPEDRPLWLGEVEGKAAPLMRAAPDGFWTLRKVSTAVNSNRADGPELVEEVG